MGSFGDPESRQQQSKDHVTDTALFGLPCTHDKAEPMATALKGQGQGVPMSGNAASKRAERPFPSAKIAEISDQLKPGLKENNFIRSSVD